MNGIARTLVVLMVLFLLVMVVTGELISISRNDQDDSDAG